ncbi:RNA-binding protein [Ensifer sp. LCM 4579]|nr:RNA-binding protein [Ensifer sp. LCM 4579]
MAEYFDAIRDGTKTEEFRLVSDYWTKRLHDRTGAPRVFSEIALTKGYPPAGDTSRRLVLPWRGFTRRTITHPHFGPDPVEVYAIEVRRGDT